jgi:hypothetical protein
MWASSCGSRRRPCELALLQGRLRQGRCPPCGARSTVWGCGRHPGEGRHTRLLLHELCRNLRDRSGSPAAVLYSAPVHPLGGGTTSTITSPMHPLVVRSKALDWAPHSWNWQ